MIWELIAVDETDCTIDHSGIYTIINRLVGDKNHIRLDIMTDQDEPVQSFRGSADNVRKYVINWLFKHCYTISNEHAAYIGSELTKAELTENYVQD